MDTDPDYSALLNEAHALIDDPTFESDPHITLADQII